MACPFLRLKSFLKQDLEAVLILYPKSLQNQEKYFCFVQTVSQFQSFGCTIFTKFLAMLFSVQTDALGPEACALVQCFYQK